MWKRVGGGIQRAIESWPCLQSTNCWFRWIQDIGIVLRVSLSSGSMDKGSCFRSNLETRVFLSKWIWNFSTYGHLCKFLDHDLVASIPTWNLPKHSWMTHQNPVLMHDWNSMPRVGIQHVCMKAFRRWDSKCHRMMIVARIDEPSTLLGLGHRDSARGFPLLSLHGQGILF